MASADLPPPISLPEPASDGCWGAAQIDIPQLAKLQLNMKKNGVKQLPKQSFLFSPNPLG